MDKPFLMWAAFAVLVVTLLVLDLGVFHRRPRAIGVKESLYMTLFYLVIGFSFGGFIWIELGPGPANEYITGYLVEKSLSLDNLFVMSLIFTYFAIPPQYQHRVLFWGILGVIILRGITIGLGAAIVSQFHWVLWIFAAFLVVTGVKMFFIKDDAPMDVGDNRLLRWLRNHLPITEELHGSAFTVWRTYADRPTKKIRFYTPLFLALVLIEMADLIFAVDSIPAIFAITTDPYIVYTSNIFAILGLRALYFAVRAVIDRFEYLQYALACILIFIGGKVLLADFTPMEEVSAGFSLTVTVGLLVGGILFSLYKTRQQTK